MDPNACLERIERWLQKIGRQERASHSCKQKFKQELDIACEDLATWLHKGGLPGFTRAGLIRNGKLILRPLVTSNYGIPDWRDAFSLDR